MIALYGGKWRILPDRALSLATILEILMSTEPSPDDAQPSETKILIDTDWKEEAQAEKEKFGAVEQKVEERAESRQLPEANFRGLLGILASQALMGLGIQQDPTGKGVMVDLEGAKFTIDLMGMLEEKTKGNLNEDEVTELKQLIQELQSRFVNIAELISAQMQEGGATTAGSGNQPYIGNIIDPTA